MANFDYTKYSYDELVQEVTRLVSAKDEWKDAYMSSTGQVLIQVVAAITDQMMYMLERRSQENFLPTAKLETSVNAIVNSIGYRPRRKVSASGTLSLTLVDGNGIPVQNTDTITIPKYSKLTFGDDVFVNTDDITLLSTQVYPYTFTIKEGTLVSLTYDPSDITGSLYLNDYIEIEDYLNIENTSFYIYTATQTFTDVIERVGDEAPIDSLSFAEATDEVYDLNNTNNGLRLLFGDGTSGEKPTGILTVKYIESSGNSVEVLTTDNNFVFDDYATELIDASSDTYKYTLTNTTTIDSGLNEETIDEVKKNAPSYVRTANRAASKNDYIFWVNRSGIGGIVDSNVYGEEEIGISVINANNVYIIYLTNDGLALSSNELSILDNYVDNYKIVTSQTIYEAATVIPLQIELKIKRSPTLTASSSEIYDVLKNDMVDYFEFAEGTLGKNTNHSEVVDHFHLLTIVKNGITRLISDYINIDIKALYAFSTPWESVNDIDITFTYGADGNVYTILLNDVPYSYTAQGGDTVTEVVGKLLQYIRLDLNVIPSVVSNVITLARDNSTAENLLIHSEELDDAVWSLTGTMTITPDADVAPNGLTVATTLNDTDAVITSNILQTASMTLDNNYKTVSVFIKKDSDTSRFPALYIKQSGGSSIQSFVSINTQTGATAWISGSVPTIVTDDFIDYWRISVTLQNNITNNVVEMGLYPAYSSTLGGAADGTLTGTITAFGLQAENKGAVGKYIRTTSKPLLLTYGERAIENRLLYNEELNNTVWIKTGTTITPDSLNDSDGFLTVDTVTFAGSAAGETVSQTINNIHSGTAYTFGWRAQEGSLSTAGFGAYDVTNAAWIVDPATTIKTYTATLDLYEESFVVPETCTSIRIHPVYKDNTAGTVYVGQSHLRITANSNDYIQSHEKQSFYYDEGFFITNTGTTILANAAINIPVQLPLSVLNNPESNQLFYPSSIEIIETDGTIIATDDGAGNIYGGTVDYITGVVTIPLLADDDYYIRYQQNVEQNFTSNERQAFSYSLPKTNYVDVTELLSTIEIIN